MTTVLIVVFGLFLLAKLFLYGAALFLAHKEPELFDQSLPKASRWKCKGCKHLYKKKGAIICLNSAGCVKLAEKIGGNTVS